MSDRKIVQFHVPRLSGLRALLPNVAGLGLLCAGAWTGLGMSWGLAAAGVSTLVLGWLAESRPTQEEGGIGG